MRQELLKSNITWKYTIFRKLWKLKIKCFFSLIIVLTIKIQIIIVESFQLQLVILKNFQNKSFDFRGLWVEERFDYNI